MDADFDPYTHRITSVDVMGFWRDVIEIVCVQIVVI